MKFVVPILVLLAVVVAGLVYFLRPLPEVESPVIPPEDPTITAPLPEEESAPAPPEGYALLEEASTALAGLEVLAFDFTTTVSIIDPARKHDTLIEGHLLLGAGNRGVMHLKTDQEEIKVFNGPEGRVAYLPQKNQYQRTAAQDTRQALVATMAPGILELPSAWLASLVSGTLTTPENAVITGGSYADTETWEVSAETPRYRLQAHFSARPPRLPLRVAMELKGSVVKQHTPTPGTSITITTEFKNWQLEASAPDSTFAFIPPPEAKEDVPTRPAARGALGVGAAAPDFSLELLTGGTVRLKDHIDKDIVILDFWASWCGPCRRAMPLVAAVAERFADQGVILYAVNVRETPEKAQAFLDSQNLSLPVLLDRNGQVGALYQVTGIPRLVLVGKDGLIKSIHPGMSANITERLTSEIEALL